MNETKKSKMFVKKLHAQYMEHCHVISRYACDNPLNNGTLRKLQLMFMNANHQTIR